MRMAVWLCATLARNLTAERHSSTALGFHFRVRIFIHLNWLLVVVVVSLVALDLFAHDRDVLIDLGCDTVDAGLGEGDAGAVRRQVCGAAWGTLQSAPGDLSWGQFRVWRACRHVVP